MVMNGKESLMEKKSFLSCTILCCTVLFSTIPALYSFDDMGTLNVDIEISTTALHEWMPSVTYNPIDNEFLVLWHTTGVREEGGENMYSLHAQRISPDGTLLEEAFSPLASVGPGRRLLPKAAHNIFTNQYMVTFCMEQAGTGWDPFVTLIESDGTIRSGPIALSEQPTNANHAFIAFNSTRREYLVAYNDSRNGEHDIFGVILNEEGSVVKEDFEICTAEGEQQNPFVYYNPKNDTYLLNWEDFRHVSTWTEPGDIYGILLNGDGNVLVKDIPMVDDFGNEDEGGQWLNNIAYNPVKNEFLVSWMDTRPSMENVGIVGRIIKQDGMPAGPDFTLVDDAPGAQFWHQALYLPGRNMYCAVWQDGRNDDPDIDIMSTTNSDIYGTWLSSAGKPMGTEFPISTEENNQRYTVVAYNPLMDRLLIVWRDELEEEVLDGGGSGHVTASGGNIMGKIYGVPSFLTFRVLDQETGDPVQGALALVIGPAVPAMKRTNRGGWFNIAENAQPEGNYLVVLLKFGYHMTSQFVDYTGTALQETIAMQRWR
jgi:hypothetical protein